MGSAELFGPVVTPDWLRGRSAEPGLRIIDFRWYLDGRPGIDGYRRGHLPGAVYVDHDSEVTGHATGMGRHPLPEREQFTLAMRRAGVGKDTRVVVYDDQGGFVAARLWWLLRYFGHQHAAILDGGIQAWRSPLETEPYAPPPGDFQAGPPRTELKIDYEELRALPPGATVLLDARPPERFRGDEEPIDPKAGHIPGAHNAPWERNIDEQARLRDPAELRHHYAELGVRTGPETVVYCGSGARACHDILAMETAGLPGARLYPGSWSDWSNRTDAPVATGDG